MKPSIRLTDVCYKYKNSLQGKNAIDGLSFEIEEGSFVCILGSNGSGKSTLAKLLNGILIPTSGKIERFKQTVSLVFQNPDNQIVASVVEDDTAFGPENTGVESSAIEKIVSSSLKEVSMAQYSKHETGKLSGGQKQKVCIAGALAMQSKCIVMDEPLSMLDPQSKQEVLGIIAELCRNNCTVIMVTHDVDAAQNADRLILLNEGKIVADSNPENIFCNSEILKTCSLKLSPALQFRNFLKGRHYEN